MKLALGKREPKLDSRTIKFRALLPMELPPPPVQYDVDFDNQDIWPLPMPMFANDQWGDCVIAGRANYTLRAEKLETGRAVTITDQDVLNEYWYEQGGNGTTRPDEGLYILDSLKLWRTEGWAAGGQLYKIYAFASVSPNHRTELKLGVYLLSGLIAGVNLPLTAQQQIKNKQVWEDMGDDPNAEPGTWGGHCIYIIGYTATGPVCLTWGQRQVMTWNWWDRYCDELYGVVDDKDKADSNVDIDKLNSILQQIAE